VGPFEYVSVTDTLAVVHPERKEPARTLSG
jgi:hypothetical protein